MAVRLAGWRSLLAGWLDRPATLMAGPGGWIVGLVTGKLGRVAIG
jgi:hypothetical protein